MVSNNKSDAAYNEQEGISIVDLIKILWRGKWIIAITLVVCLLAASVYSFFITEDSYISTASLSIKQSENPKYDINTYVQKMTNLELFSIAAASLSNAEQNITAEQISSSATITANEELSTIKVSVEMADPQMSADVANSIIDSFPAYITEIVSENAEAELDDLEDYLTESRLELDEKFDELTEYMNKYEGIGNIQNEIEALREQQVDLLVLENNTRTNIETYSLQIVYLLRIAQWKGIEIVTYVPIDESYMPSIKSPSAINTNNTVSESVLIDQINEIQNDIVEEQSRIIAINNSISVIDDQLAKKESYYNEYGCQYDMMAREYNSKKEMCISYLSQIADIQKVSYSKFGEEHINVEMRAAVPQAPVDTNKFRTIAVLGIIGLVLGGIIVLFRNYWIKEKGKLKE